MTLVERGGKAPLHVPAETHRIFDVTGAGDTVVATIASALAVGAPLADAVRLANTAAGIVVAKPGTATAQPQELRQALGAAEGDGVVARVGSGGTRERSGRISVSRSASPTACSTFSTAATSIRSSRRSDASTGWWSASTPTLPCGG